MKNLLLTSLLASSAIIGCYAQDPEEPLYTLKFGSDYNFGLVSGYTSEFYVITDETRWNISNFNNNNTGTKTDNDGNPLDEIGSGTWDFIRAGSKSAASKATIATANPLSGKINKIVIDGTRFKNGTTDKANSVKLAYGPSIEAMNDTVVLDVNTVNTGTAGTAWTLTANFESGLENQMFNLIFDLQKATNNGFVQINNIKYYGDPEGVVLLSPEISFPQSEYSVIFGTAFEAPQATATSNGEITYSSLNEDVATVNTETGEVTLIGLGSAVIKATIAATDTYKAGSASYTLNVVEDPANIVLNSPMGEDFDFEAISGTDQPWKHDTQYGLKASAYINGASVATEAIAVSPIFNLANRSEIILNFDQALNNFKINNTLIPVADAAGYVSVVVKEVGIPENGRILEGTANAWTEIGEVTLPASFGWTFYANNPIDLSSYANKLIQVGFKYKSTAECAGTWEIKNISVKGKMVSGLSDLETEESIPVYYNLQGVRVSNPEKGIYIEVKGNKSRKIMK